MVVAKVVVIELVVVVVVVVVAVVRVVELVVEVVVVVSEVVAMVVQREQLPAQQAHRDEEAQEPLHLPTSDASVLVQEPIESKGEAPVC